MDGMLKGEGLPAWSELRIEADENESKEEAENGDANKRALEPAVDQSNPKVTSTDPIVHHGSVYTLFVDQAHT